MLIMSYNGMASVKLVNSYRRFEVR